MESVKEGLIEKTAVKEVHKDRGKGGQMPKAADAEKVSKGGKTFKIK